MGTLGWLLVVAIGIALGFSVGRLWPGTAAKLTELERQRDTAREDLQTYRQDVSSHFERTAELFDKVTADYRGLYEHLATSARRLGAIKGESVQAPPLAEPERRRLAEPEPVIVAETAEVEDRLAGIEEQPAEAEAQLAEIQEQAAEAEAQLAQARKLAEGEAGEFHQSHQPRDYPPAANDEPGQPEAPEELAEDEEKPAESR